MNILQIAPKVPYPLLDGGAIGIYNITKHLSERGHKITFVTFSNNDNSYAGFKKYCNLITIKKDTSNKISGIVKNLFSSVPYTHYKYRSDEFFEVINKELSTGKYDVVHLDHLHMSCYGSYIKENYKIPVYLREHNYETLIWERLYNSEKNFFKKCYFKNQYKKIKKYEPVECRKFDKCMMVTESDAEKLRLEDKSLSLDVVPAGVDLDFFPASESFDFDKKTLLFIGSLDWFPNIDAFKWFYTEIFPELKKRFPEIILNVVGKNPPEEIKNIVDPSVNILGMVDDARPFFKKAHVCVVPLRIGGGMRIKILEMFAMKKAVVSTSIGAEGITVEHNKHLLLADSKTEIIESIARLFDEEGLSEKLGMEGYNLVCNKYSWPSIAEQIEKIYLEKINN